MSSDERRAIVARIFSLAQVDCAAAVLREYDADAQDVVQEVLVALLEGEVRAPSERV